MQHHCGRVALCLLSSIAVATGTHAAEDKRTYVSLGTPAIECVARELSACKLDSTCREKLAGIPPLEPTPDGDDALPVWLARSAGWANDLASLTQREVRVGLAQSSMSTVEEGVVVAELNWRESWLSP